MNPMTAADYRRARLARGTQAQVAELLGVRRATVADREGGKVAVSTEAELALLSLSTMPSHNSPVIKKLLNHKTKKKGMK